MSEPTHSSTMKNAFFFGVIIGGILAVLLTPKRGEEFRNDLRNSINLLKSKSDESKEIVESDIHETMPILTM